MDFRLFLESPRPILASRIVELIYKNTDAHLDMRRLRDVVYSLGNYWVLVDFPVSKLMGLRDVDVKPGLAVVDKGPIVVKPDGEIIDGRHRAALAAQGGQMTIQAYVPYE